MTHPVFQSLNPSTRPRLGPRSCTCVHLDVLVEGVALGKGPEAHLTFEGLRARVDPVVVLQVLLGGKALAARLAHEGPLTCTGKAR